MTAGDLIWKDHQYEFRNWVFGSQTDFITEEVIGLLGMPQVRSEDTDLGSDHGASATIPLMSKRIVTFAVRTALSTSEVDPMLATVRKSLQLPRKRYGRQMDSFVWRRDGVKWQGSGRCDNREIPSNYELFHGLAVIDFQITLTDPIWYSVIEYQDSMGLAIGELAGSVWVTNGGWYEDGYEPTLVIGGPCTNPRITNAQDDNRTIALDIAVGAGQTLTINVKTREVDLDGVDRYDAVRNDNQWWALLPDANQITYNRDAGDTGASSELTIIHRHTIV